MTERNIQNDVAWSDARWVFAARVAESLEGYSAAIVTPEKRDQLLRLATVLGLRPFDANLIIAIVQDSVRCGLDPLSQSTADRLQMVAAPQPASKSLPRQSRLMICAWAVMLGLAGALALVRFFGG